MNNKKTILYVDDDDINLYLFEVTFKDKWNVITASSGKEGISVLENNDKI